jgi:hypothetical protein
MLFSFAIIFVLAMFLSCSSDDGLNLDEISSNGSGSNSSSSNENGTPPGSSNANEWPFDLSGETLTPTPGLGELSLKNVIEIKYKNGNAPEIINTLSEVLVELTGENVIVTLPDVANTETEYNLILSGTASNGSLKIYGAVRKGLYLNSVNITNSKGPAINIQGSKRAIVHLLNGTQNFLADGPNYTPTEEDAKGTFFSEGKLSFEGSGSLEVRAKYKHAIAVDNDFEINNGKITVSEAASDGIHANDIVEIKGGILKITSTGDAIQSEDKQNGTVIITSGKIQATTTGIKSHGIASEGPISIKGDAVVQISVSGNGSKGIRSRNYVDLLGGKTSIKTSGTKHTDPTDPEDESSPAGIKLETDLIINGGELTIKSLGNGAKGINADRDATISKGNVNIEADDNGIKVDGNLKIEGGTVYVKSKKKKAIDAGLYNKTGGNVNLVDSEF